MLDAMIITAFNETGLRPKSRTTLNGGCACPIGAMMVLAYGRYEARKRIAQNMDPLAEIARKNLGIPPKFAQALILGWDNKEVAGGLRVNQNKGFKLGVALREYYGC